MFLDLRKLPNRPAAVDSQKNPSFPVFPLRIKAQFVSKRRISSAEIRSSEEKKTE